MGGGPSFVAIHYHWLAVATTRLVDENREFDVKFEAYCEVFCPLLIEDSLRT